MSKVLFVSRRPLGRAENITAVFDAFDGEKEFIQETWRDPDPRIFSKEFSVIVTDEFVNYSPGTQILIGHGISGGKSYGLDQPNRYFKRKDAQLIDWAVCTSVDTIELTAKQSGIPVEKVLPLGMPRTDQYFGKKKGDGGTQLTGKRVYLFAPTFRNPREPAMPDINWKWLDMQLRDDELLVVKPHMVTKHILRRRFRHIIEAPSTAPSAPYLIDCDVLISDYSTIVFDGHVLNKPVVLFEKKKGFVDKRGMYFKYPEEYASRYVRDENELLQVIRTANEPQEADRWCKERACGACDGHSTERVVRLIRGVYENPDFRPDF